MKTQQRFFLIFESLIDVEFPQKLIMRVPNPDMVTDKGTKQVFIVFHFEHWFHAKFSNNPPK